MGASQIKGLAPHSEKKGGDTMKKREKRPSLTSDERLKRLDMAVAILELIVAAITLATAAIQAFTLK